mmetsp:Transcript_113554/g.301758  ORF Transcript_113554/g.301758 Transcript_113554/m.301758 type:complete len:104 (-) Transcript_113554:593-904(-)
MHATTSALGAAAGEPGVADAHAGQRAGTAPPLHLPCGLFVKALHTSDRLQAFYADAVLKAPDPSRTFEALDSCKRIEAVHARWLFQAFRRFRHFEAFRALGKL